MAVDGAFWRTLRADFESLQGHQFSLIWSSDAPLNWAGEPLDSQWSWFQNPDESLRARISSMALRGARALGYNSEDAWYDLLRTSAFVRFKLSGRSREKRSDGVSVELDSGEINDVVKESSTLCYELEVEASAGPLPSNGPGNRTLSARGTELADVTKTDTASAAVRILRAAMEERGLNVPKLAMKVVSILRREGQKKAKADRSTVYRILGGQTKRPQPAIRNALVEALQLSEEHAKIIRRELSGGIREP